MSERNRTAVFGAVDIIKWIMALCVVAIHTNVLMADEILQITSVVDTFIRMAVPFFFMSSSFLLFRKLPRTPEGDWLEPVKKYIIRMIRLYVIWTVIYLIPAIYRYVVHQTPLFSVVLGLVRGVFLMGENYLSWHLWYLLSTIYFSCVIYFLLRHQWKAWHILALSAMVFLLSLGIGQLVGGIDNYTGLFQTVVKMVRWVFDQGRLLTGFFYLAVGLCVAFYPKMRDIPWGIYLLVAAVSFVLTTIWDNEVSKQILYISFFLFVITVRIPFKSWCAVLRKSSTIIYFTHMLFVFVLTLMWGEENGDYLPRFFVVSAGAVLLSFVLIFFQKKRNSKIFAYLFG